MAKDKSKKATSNESEISDSGVLSMDMEDFSKAVERRTWKNSGAGGSLPDVGEYDVTITAITRGTSKGAATSGSPNYRTEGEIADGPFAGSKVNIFTIAAGSTMQRYLKFLEAVMGITAADIPSVNGRPQIPLISQIDAEKQVGKTVRVDVQHRARNDGSKNADGTPRMGTDCDFVLSEDGILAAGKKKKKDKGAIAE